MSRSNRLAATVAPRLIDRRPASYVFGICLVVCGAPATAPASEPGGATSAVAASAADAAEVRSFFTRHCVDCHGADEAKGGLRLDTLTDDFVAAGTARTWTKVLERVASGEMPPKDSPRPPAVEVKPMREWIHDRLLAEDARTRPAPGSLTLRRLNRVQYENTVRDLLSIELELQDRLPVDNRALGFDNIGAALNLSSTQLEAYLEAADAALDAAIVTRPKPEVVKQRISGLQALGEIHVRRNGAIQELEDAAIGYGRLQFYASRDAAPQDGNYRVRAAMFAHQSGGEPVEVYVRSMHKTGG